jgi:hypothetical protein
VDIPTGSFACPKIMIHLYHSFKHLYFPLCSSCSNSFSDKVFRSLAERRRHLKTLAPLPLAEGLCRKTSLSPLSKRSYLFTRLPWASSSYLPSFCCGGDPLSQLFPINQEPAGEQNERDEEGEDEYSFGAEAIQLRRTTPVIYPLYKRA